MIKARRRFLGYKGDPVALGLLGLSSFALLG
jgi:hypothetical protein